MAPFYNESSDYAVSRVGYWFRYTGCRPGLYHVAMYDCGMSVHSAAVVDDFGDLVAVPA